MNLLKRLFLILIGDRFKSGYGADHEFSNLTDEELVEQIVRKNNTGLFGLVYDRYANRIFHKCSSFARSEEEALDLTQDVFLHLFIKLGGFKGRSKFSSWVYALTYNFCVNYVNRNKARKMSDQSASLDEEGPEMKEEIDDSELLEMQSEKLKQALEHIDPDEKSILLLKYQDDVSVKELAELLNLGESAVKMRLKRAKSRLKDVYNSLV